MNKITYTSAVQLLNSIVLDGLQSITENKFINAEKQFIKAVKITRQLNKLKRIEQSQDIVKKLKKQIKEQDKKLDH